MSANTANLTHTAADRLASATGPWGANTYSYDGVGNRTERTATPSGGSTTTETLGYPTTSNRLATITVGASTVRQFVYDGAGNITSDTRAGAVYGYTYNHANRLASLTYNSTLRGTYTYNGRSQLAVRVVSNMGSSNGTTHFVHDLWGNVIADDGVGSGVDASVARDPDCRSAARHRQEPVRRSRSPAR